MIGGATRPKSVTARQFVGVWMGLQFGLSVTRGDRSSPND
jgi:hypothetical protein